MAKVYLVPWTYLELIEAASLSPEMMVVLKKLQLVKQSDFLIIIIGI